MSESLTKAIIQILTQNLELKNLWKKVIKDYYFLNNLPVRVNVNVKMSEQEFWNCLIKEEVKVNELFSAIKNQYPGYFDEVNSVYESWKKQSVNLNIRRKLTKTPLLIKKWQEVFGRFPKWGTDFNEIWDYFVNWMVNLSEIVEKVNGINPDFAQEIVNLYLEKEEKVSFTDDQALTSEIMSAFTSSYELKMGWKAVFTDSDGTFRTNLPEFNRFLEMEKNIGRIWTEFRNHKIGVRKLLRAVKAVDPSFGCQLEEIYLKIK